MIKIESDYLMVLRGDWFEFGHAVLIEKNNNTTQTNDSETVWDTLCLFVYLFLFVVDNLCVCVCFCVWRQYHIVRMRYQYLFWLPKSVTSCVLELGVYVRGSTMLDIKEKKKTRGTLEVTSCFLWYVTSSVDVCISVEWVVV